MIMPSVDSDDYKKKLLIHILWKSFSSDDYADLKKKIDNIKGIKESFYTEESTISNIAALAEWNKDEIKERIDEIRKMRNVKDVDARILVPA
jgi:hypothetical protein